jgi:glyoxylase I family protein
MRPFAVEELDHVVLRCADQARMLTFYTGVLGLTEERRLDAIGLVQLRLSCGLITRKHRI